MAVDRYVKVVLTIIALELFWIGVKDPAPPVAAQAQPRPPRSSSAASRFRPAAMNTCRWASSASRCAWT